MQAPDMVFYIPWKKERKDRDRVLYIMLFDKEAEKYKCFDPSVSKKDPRICYCPEDELEIVPEESSLIKDSDLANPSKEKWFSQLCCPLYYYHDGKEVQFQGAQFTYKELEEWEELLKINGHKPPKRL